MISYTDNLKVLNNTSVLTIGDPHFRSKDFDEIDMYVEKLLDRIKELNPDYVVILGDVLHDHALIKNFMVMNKAIEMFVRIIKLKPLYVLVGNHDMLNNNQFLTENHWMAGIKNIPGLNIVDKGKVVDSPGGKLILVPYVPKGMFVDALNLIDPDWKSARLILAHQDFFGAKFESGVLCEDGDKWLEEYPFILSGHFHDKQRIQQNIYYIGSSRYVHASEKKEKTILLCNMKDDVLDMTEHSLGLPKNMDINIHVSELPSLELPNLDINKVRLILHGSPEELKSIKKTAKFKKIQSNDVKIKEVHVREKKTEVVNPEIKDFRQVLHSLVKDDPEMNKIYNEFF